MKGLRLYKKEKLCSLTAIETLFSADAGGARAIAFPLRAVWRENAARHADCPQFLVMVPKRRVRKAVDRVRMRRLIREAYRRNRRGILAMDARIDIAFVYVDSSLRPYAEIERSMRRLLSKIARWKEEGLR